MLINEYTPSQLHALDTLNTNRSVFLTGRPGTGKTAFINDYCERQRASGKNILLTASTGMAASGLIGGRTIHSALKWHINGYPFDYKICSEILKHTDILVIDEISMLNSNILYHIYECIKAAGNPNLQLIMSGDFFQLPPVKSTSYPFELTEWNKLNLTPCILNDVVRQHDSVFLDMLEKCRNNDHSCISYFNENTSKSFIDNAITICTTNKLADEYNTEQLDLLPGKLYTYHARGKVCKADFKHNRVISELRIKIGMRVMAIRNSPDAQYHNGSLGTVMNINENYVSVLFDNGIYSDISRVKFYMDSIDENTLAPIEIEQFPLRGGYAITVHKSQGQTFDAVNIDACRFWANGHLYVALSRAKDINRIYLRNPLKVIDLKTSNTVSEYYRHLEQFKPA